MAVCDYGSVLKPSGELNEDRLMSLESFGGLKNLWPFELFATQAFVMAALSQGADPAAVAEQVIGNASNPEDPLRGVRSVFQIAGHKFLNSMSGE